MSENRTRVPSMYRPLDQSAGLTTAAALLATESTTSSTHDAESTINQSTLTSIGPIPSVSRPAGDRTTSRSQLDDFAAEHTNTGSEGRTFNVDAGGEDRSYREFRGTRADAGLVATELGTSSTYHVKRRPAIHYLSSGTLRPTASTSRGARDRLLPPFNVDARGDDRSYGESRETRADGGLMATELGKSSTYHAKRRPAIHYSSSGTLRPTTSASRSRIFISSSINVDASNWGSSHGALGPAQALEQYNTHARELGLTLIEDEKTGKIIHRVSFVVEIVSLTSSVKTKQPPQPKPLFRKIVLLDFSKNPARAPRRPYHPSQNLGRERRVNRICKICKISKRTVCVARRLRSSVC